MQNRPLVEALKRSRYYGLYEATLERLAPFLESATPSELFRINAAELADSLQIAKDDARDFFLYGTADGIFRLSWEFHCSHCNAVTDFKHNFGEVKGTGYCPLCDVNFRNVLDSNVEVTFTVHPAVIALPPSIEEEYRSAMIEAVKQNSYSMPDRFLSGMDCLHSTVFRELFGEEVLSADESLGIERASLLFTDIKGSTKMYSDLGDTVSYNVVRNHFKILFRDIEAEKGVVVKTIGDAVMASFRSPADAIAAALRIYRDFRAERLDPAGHLEIRVGVHTGPVIVVNLNDRIDYFGNTVNIAARIQGQVQSHSVGFSKEIYEDEAVRKELRRFLDQQSAEGEPVDIMHRKTQLKGIEGQVDLYYFKDRA